MRKIITFIALIGIVAFWQISQLNIANAEEFDGKDSCGPAGVWKTANDLGGEAILAFATIDPLGITLSATGESLSPFDPRLNSRFFPRDTKATKFYGTAMRISESGYRYTVYQYGVSQKKGKVWKLVVSGESESIDCNSSLGASTLELFVFINGKEYSAGCIDAVGQSERLPLVEPCMDLPDFPE